jgi:hypothetical protein
MKRLVLAVWLCFLIFSLADAQSDSNHSIFEIRNDGTYNCIYFKQANSLERFACINATSVFAAIRSLGKDTLAMIIQEPKFPEFILMTKGKIIFFHYLWQPFNGGGMISPLDGPEYDIERLSDTSYFNIVLFDENKLVYKLGDTTQVYEWRADVKKNLDYWAEAEKLYKDEKMNKEATQMPQIPDEKKNEKPKPKKKSKPKPKSSQK